MASSSNSPEAAKDQPKLEVAVTSSVKKYSVITRTTISNERRRVDRDINIHRPRIESVTGTCDFGDEQNLEVPYQYLQRTGYVILENCPTHPGDFMVDACSRNKYVRALLSAKYPSLVWENTGVQEQSMFTNAVHLEEGEADADGLDCYHLLGERDMPNWCISLFTDCNGHTSNDGVVAFPFNGDIVICSRWLKHTFPAPSKNAPREMIHIRYRPAKPTAVTPPIEAETEAEADSGQAGDLESEASPVGSKLTKRIRKYNDDHCKPS